jgi:hypothetical protein
VRADTSHELPFCVGAEVSPAKAAIELREAEARQAALALAHPPLWLVVAGLGAAAGLLYVVLSSRD